MRVLLLVLLAALAPLDPAAANSPCGPDVQRCEPFEPCRYNPHDPLRSPVQWVLCGDAEAALGRLLPEVAP